MMKKENLLSGYTLYTRIIAGNELDIIEAKKYQKEFADKLIELNVTEEELRKIYDEIYEEVKDFKESDREYLKRKFDEGDPFKFGNMWVMPSAEDRRKGEK